MFEPLPQWNPIRAALNSQDLSSDSELGQT